MRGRAFLGAARWPPPPPPSLAKSRGSSGRACRGGCGGQRPGWVALESPREPNRQPVVTTLLLFYYCCMYVFRTESKFDEIRGPRLDCSQIFTLSPSHQFLDACTEH
jgi:hypothetical protein